MKHLLIVEDNEVISGALRILFEQQGYRVSVAGGVEEGYRVVAADIPDVMLLDLGLPDGNGLSLLARLVRDNLAPKATLALSGDETEATRLQCLAAGCRDFLVKPVPIRELVAQVQAL